MTSSDSLTDDENKPICDGGWSLEPRIFKSDEWPTQAAEQIQQAIDEVLSNKGICSVMLTGGRSAEQLYATWQSLPAFQSARGVCFYFGDERCVSPSCAESNYRMAMQTLFHRGLPAGCSVYRMEAESLDVKAAADRYAALLPIAIDVLLLSMGDDGHIASLFPNSVLLHETHGRVASVTGPKAPFLRLTVMPPVILNSRRVFILAIGQQKYAIYKEALRAPADIDAIPARLVLSGTWFFGD